MASLLDGPRARNAFLIRTRMVVPWALRIEDGAALTVLAVLAGDAVIDHPGAADGDRGPVQLTAGDLALIRGPQPYVVGDIAGTQPTMRILPGNTPVSLAGEQIGTSMNLGVRSWGSPVDPDRPTTRMLTGIYAGAGEASRRLLDALPAVCVRRAGSAAPYVQLLAAEAAVDEPGQSAVLDRLLDLVLVDGVRGHFRDHPEAAPRWYAALRDPDIGAVLRAIHDDPAAPWTVAALARRAGMSRAAFAQRFRARVGEPPMAYVTRWRLSLAADLLADDRHSVGEIAARVGYTSPFTFSAAFKRHHGRSPTSYRADSRVSEEVSDGSRSVP